MMMKTTQITKRIELREDRTEANLFQDYYYDGNLVLRVAFNFGFYSNPGPSFLAFEGEAGSPRYIDESEFHKILLSYVNEK